MENDIDEIIDGIPKDNFSLGKTYAKQAIQNYVASQVAAARYQGELTGMENCWKHIRVHLNDNQGFVRWYENRKNAIETAYMSELKEPK